MVSHWHADRAGGDPRASVLPPHRALAVHRARAAVQPKLYTIAPDRPFLATVAEGLLAIAGDDPLALPRATVLLPTRRAVRALREAFLRVLPDGRDPGTPMLLPRMRPIGDFDSDELSLVEGVAENGDLTVPPAIPELRRRLLLARLVLEWGRRGSRDPLLPGQAAALAVSLARFLDTVETEGASFARLADLAPADMAEHWQIVRSFLEILPAAWPGILAAEGALDPADRRNRLLAQQAAIWRRSPPRDPVIAAGLTGGIPAMTELISVVATLDRGAVILPGLDRFCDVAQWAAIEDDEAHPQHLIATLLKALDLSPAEVPDWPPALASPLCRGPEALADLPLFTATAKRLTPQTAPLDPRFRGGDKKSGGNAKSGGDKKTGGDEKNGG